MFLVYVDIDSVFTLHKTNPNLTPGFTEFKYSSDNFIIPEWAIQVHPSQ